MFLKLAFAALILLSLGAARGDESHDKTKTGSSRERDKENPWNSEGYRALPGVPAGMNLDDDGWKTLTKAGIDLPKACMQLVQHKSQPKDAAFILVGKKSCADEDVIMKEKDVALRFPTTLHEMGEVGEQNAFAGLLASFLGVNKIRIGGIYHPDYDNKPIGYFLEEPDSKDGKPHRMMLLALCTKRTIEGSINPQFDFSKLCKVTTKKGNLVGIELNETARAEIAETERETERRSRQTRYREPEREYTPVPARPERQQTSPARPVERQESWLARDARTYREGWYDSWSLNPIRAEYGKQKQQEIERKWSGDFPGSYEAGRDAALLKLDWKEAWRYEQRRAGSELLNQIGNGILGR